MPARHFIACAAGLLFIAVLAPACGGNDASPTPIVTPSTVALTSSTPAPGSTLTPVGTPPGTFFTRGSGQFGVTVTITAGQDLPFAQLAVFLLTTAKRGRVLWAEPARLADVASIRARANGDVHGDRLSSVLAPVRGHRHPRCLQHA